MSRRDAFLGMASDKHLDAEWKRIQKKTFTRWCNEHLKAKLLKIEDLDDSLSDGVKLIVLLELLSQKKLGRYNKKPKVRAHKMENAEVALDFLMKKERIRLVNIGMFAVICCKVTSGTDVSDTYRPLGVHSNLLIPAQ